MKRRVTADGTLIEYELTRKRVKNINVRISTDGKVSASAPYFVSLGAVDSLVIKCKDKIVRAREKLSKNAVRELTAMEKKEFKNALILLTRQTMALFPEIETPFPEIKLRKMTSRWGSCNVAKNIITYSTELYFKSEECRRYVAAHELCHLLVQNHSKAFWERLEKAVPDCKKLRKKLNER